MNEKTKGCFVSFSVFNNEDFSENVSDTKILIRSF